jgi:hypothetical protein
MYRKSMHEPTYDRLTNTFIDITVSLNKFMKIGLYRCNGIGYDWKET